ncbi:anchored wall transfer protein 1 [Seminavis robusta]|uniref:Anchored wall transfer protein 1 n=1 Tax=Seminavis robusta TaxID=568900 RepID=A0A9N8DF09_9STRA|nr:anchored wall transfer protein 1 [Seminavis robusta]|eukprot:Sro125_g060300.1 anchored wall transfer protein 1 (538) ;mRNA; f:75388-77001
MAESSTTLPPSTPSLKEQKELFVTGHDGTSPWEILLVCSAAPIGIWLFQSIRALERYVQDDNNKRRQQQPANPTASIAMEAALLWFPVLVCQTNLLYPWGAILLYLQVQLCVLIYLYFWTTKRWMRIKGMQQQPINNLDTVQEEEGDPDEMEQKVVSEEQQIMKDSMTVYRSSLQYLTFVAILAVDFHIFPRRFAKTEVAGYGLMDLGAGSFVVAAGLVSSRARHSRQQAKKSSISFGQRDVIRIAPLWIIGFIRLATNKGLEYQEHVSEYGVHWNFFFTLAMVTPLGSMLPGNPNWIVPICLLAAYQVALTQYGGQEFIENAPRTHCSSTALAALAGENEILLNLCTLFAANREGVLGCIGYLFLYLASEYIAFAFLWTKGAQTASSSLWVIAVGLWLLLYGLSECLEIAVSRRSTNASFCVWTLAHSMLILAVIHAAMGFYEDPKQSAQAANNGRPRVPIVFQAVNRHGFLSFLIANLLTGLTNLTINTLEVSDPVAFIILFVYLSAVGFSALALHYAMAKVAKSNEKVEKEKKE